MKVNSCKSRAGPLACLISRVQMPKSNEIFGRVAAIAITHVFLDEVLTSLDVV